MERHERDYDNLEAHSHVVSHYNERQDTGVDERQQSPVIDLRKFNNWVKSVLIGRHCLENAVVLDLCAGKGGDIRKWLKSRASIVVFADVAESSVKDALRRYNEVVYGDSRRFRSQFVVCDAFGVRLRDHYRLQNAVFSLVSCQFALHYAFASEERANMALANAGDLLKSGGRFVCTLTNAERICERVVGAGALAFGRPGVYRVDFAGSGFSVVDFARPASALPEFGAKYLFTLSGSVDAVPEYLVRRDTLARVALAHGLRLEECLPFQDFYDKYYMVGGFPRACGGTSGEPIDIGRGTQSPETDYERMVGKPLVTSSQAGGASGLISPAESEAIEKAAVAPTHSMCTLHWLNDNANVAFAAALGLGQALFGCCE